jgi:hypothetical protein
MAGGLKQIARFCSLILVFDECVSAAPSSSTTYAPALDKNSFILLGQRKWHLNRAQLRQAINGTEAAAHDLKIQLQTVMVSGPGELDSAMHPNTSASSQSP